MPVMHTPFVSLIAAALLATAPAAFAQDPNLRKILAERLEKLPPIDEISKTPIPGIYEVRYAGTEILYVDEKGDYIFANGSLIDTRTRTDLTDARVNKLLAIDFDKLPIKDAIAVKQGNGSRKMAVFADPNCGYCKRFERDVLNVKDVTIYTFLMPILGADSRTKSRDIWCAKDPAKVWRDWMLDGVQPPKASPKCDFAAIERTLAFSKTHRINGTPAVFFTDGTRMPGAIPAAQVEQLLTAAAAGKK